MFHIEIHQHPVEMGSNYPDLLAECFGLFAISTHCQLTFSSMSITTPGPV